ncbi:YbjN domain-containing protein [Haloimpatiens lingqiaonensis]|uniref:YbjN domain-containing protein n=1 Tax=Haloimpatiens lingqiaonensis TaxID=1380675 RepID=UPI0010FE314F|nr:YbjN domain-containing protein [Haloimpatiens lingqiaonensis]
MNNTATRFSNLLEKNGFPMPIIKVQEDGNETIFAFGQIIKNHSVNIVIDFDEDNTCVDFNIFDLIQLSDESNTAGIYNLINRINGSYRFPKFYINEEGSVAAQITVPYENSVSEEMLFDMLRSMMTFCNNVMDDLEKASK